MKEWLLSLLVIGFSIGCSVPASKYADVSTEPRFQNIVPSNQATTSELLILGIDAYPSKNEIKYYVLTPRPGFDGPEVLSRSVLPAGTRVRVVGAESCSNCSGKRERLLVEVANVDERLPSIWILDLLIYLAH